MTKKKTGHKQSDTDAMLKGVGEIISREELDERLAKGTPLNVKAGFDPTSPDLHLGHTVLFNCLRQFQDAGHWVDFLIGDFTGLIGDPSGRDKTRPPLEREEVEANATTYAEQVFKVLLPEKTRVRYNSEWMRDLSAVDMIRLASQQTVARMLERDDFKKRYAEEQAISIHEFLYPLIQGYDSVVLKSDVEFGGSDQKFNLLMGRALQNHYGMPRQIVIMVELLEGLDGQRKMSKSLDNHIGINEPPVEMYGKLMAVSDELMWRYYDLLSFLSSGQINDLKKQVDEGRNPRDVKVLLATEIVERFHGAAAARQAADDFVARFRHGEMPSDMPTKSVRTDEETMSLTRLLKQAGLTPSTSESIRMIKAGAVKVDGDKVDDPDTHVAVGSDCVYQVGKRKFCRVSLSRASD